MTTFVAHRDSVADPVERLFARTAEVRCAIHRPADAVLAPVLWRVLILSALLISMSVPAMPQSPFNASGYWAGIRTYAGPIPASLQIVLIQGPGGAVTGTVLLQDTDDPSSYALMSATGTVSGSTLNFQDTAFLINVPPPDGEVWCLRSGTLTISADGNNLSGTMIGTGDCDNQATYDVTRTDISGLLTGDPSDLPGATSGQCPCQTDPISIGSGNVHEQVTDYVTAGPNPLGFTRYYNSLVASLTHAVTLGSHWRSTYDRYLTVVSASQVTAERPDGLVVSFSLTAGVWTPNTFIDLALVQNGSSWTLTDHNDTRETYAPTSSGALQLTSIVSRNGCTQTLVYNASHQLTSVTDSYSRTLTLAYNSSGLLQSVSTPDSTTITYGFTPVGGSNALTSASYSTIPATSIAYQYQDTSLPFALTAIIDQKGNSYETWTYDTSGRGLSSQRGTGPTADLTQVAYNDSNGFRTVTNALGLQETYQFIPMNSGVPTLVEIDRAASGAAAAATETFTYDTNGYLAGRTDWNGNQTTYVNDTHGDPTTINEAVGTPQARTTTITYDRAFVHLPDKIVTPGLTTAFTYDGSGNPLTKTLSDTTTTSTPYSTGGTVRTWTYTWSDFLLASVRGPRTDVTALTTYSNDSAGALISITNALGQTTRITHHTGAGLPLTIVDANDVTTQLTYDARDRLLTSAVTTTAGVLTTSFAYDPAGNLISVTLPDGSQLTNTYDGAHRLTGVSDLLNQTIAYTLNALGERTQTNISDATGAVQRKHSAVFDALGRILQDIGGVGQTTAYTYDANGNALTVTDPLQHKAQQTFDALNRLTKITNAAGGATSVSYDPHDRPVSVTDPISHTTTYVYDGFGDVIEQVSPASGTTVYRYDLAGNMIQRTDATGAVANHTYDALNRVLSDTYPADTAEDVTYVYDQSGHGFGIGRLTTVSDAAGTLNRSYDERGNLLTEVRVHGSTTLTTSHSYDPAGRVASISYPSGYTTSYARDVMGRTTALTVRGSVPAAGQSVVSRISYKPFGPVTALSYSNGVVQTRSFDLDYRLTGLADAGERTVQSLAYGYDASNNVLSTANAVTAGYGQTFAYDVLNRLTNATGGYGTLAYTYDANGNRLTETPGGAAVSVTAAGLDGLGSVSALAYNQAGRLSTASTAAQVLAQYTYDAFGKRIVKTQPAASTTTLYSYDSSSRLLEESNNLGNPAAADYIYLDDGNPIATLTPGTGSLYYLHDDRLGTPQLATDGSQNIAWSANYQPFGQTANVQAPIVQNLRLPGQYYDAETGWNHNGFREYLPGLGRYLQPDPVGIGKTTNLYSYALGNPLRYTDASGLCVGPLIIECAAIAWDAIEGSAVYFDLVEASSIAPVLEVESVYYGIASQASNIINSPAGTFALSALAAYLGVDIPDNFFSGETADFYSLVGQFAGEVVDAIHEYLEGSGLSDLISSISSATLTTPCPGR